MIEEFVSAKEYPAYFAKLNGLRRKIATELPIAGPMRILDVATGQGYFAMEILDIHRAARAVGIDIARTDIQAARRNAEQSGMTDRFQPMEMDATAMSFTPRSFDIAVNFLGLEDIHMTRGKNGVRKAFLEVHRVLKPGGYFSFVAMPPEEMETEAQKLDVTLFSEIFGATWLGVREYEKMLRESGFRPLSRKKHYTGKRLTWEQARKEIEFACENVPKIYGIDAPSIRSVWDKYGREIHKHGLGHYSKVISFLNQSVGPLI